MEGKTESAKKTLKTFCYFPILDILNLSKIKKLLYFYIKFCEVLFLGAFF